MKRLLCIVSSMNVGGAETFLMKIYRDLNKGLYQMDFCVNNESNFYKDEILGLGGKIYVIPSKSQSPIKHFTFLYNIVKSEKYYYVMRVNEHSLSVLDLLAAKKAGANRLIMRSSNAGSENSITTALHKAFKFLPKFVPNVKIAPSDLAAEYTFGKKAVRNGNVVFLPNGIDTKKFSFNNKARESIRENLNIQDKVVLGHIGRFSEQKNHDFLIDIFYEYHAMNKDSVLLLIGDGPLKDRIADKVNSLGLVNSVKFLGIRKDIPQLLSAMDLFVFPSFYEGMPNTVIEAQTTGLKCLISDAITKESQITDAVRFKELQSGAYSWAINIDEIIREKHENRIDYAEKMRAKNYDLSDVVEKFTSVVFD